MKRLLSLVVLAAFTLGIMPSAHAQSEVTMLCPNPIQEAIDKLVAGFEAKTGTHVKLTYGSGLSTRKSVASGEALDVSVMFAPFPEALATGNIVPSSATVLARLRLGVAVQKGAAKPDISTAEAVKKALLNAKSIVGIDPAGGSAGQITLAAFDKLGITEQIKSKLKWVRNANLVQEALAKGEAEIAVGPYLSEMHNPNIDIVGALPVEVSTPVDITGFLSTSAKDSKGAKALLDYLGSHEVAGIYEEAKIFPAR